MFDEMARCSDEYKKIKKSQQQEKQKGLDMPHTQRELSSPTRARRNSSSESEVGGLEKRKGGEGKQVSGEEVMRGRAT